MKIEVTGRAGGKTSSILRKMALDVEHSMCICSSAQDAEGMFKLAMVQFPELAWSRDQFLAVSSQNLQHSRHRPEWRNKYMDNADRCLQALFGDLRMVTWDLYEDFEDGRPRDEPS